MNSVNNKVTYCEEEMAIIKEIKEIEELEDYLEILNKRCKKYDYIHLRKQVLNEWKIKNKSNGLTVYNNNRELNNKSSE